MKILIRVSYPLHPQLKKLRPSYSGDWAIHRRICFQLIFKRLYFFNVKSRWFLIPQSFLFCRAYGEGPKSVSFTRYTFIFLRSFSSAFWFLFLLFLHTSAPIHIFPCTFFHLSDKHCQIESIKWDDSKFEKTPSEHVKTTQFPFWFSGGSKRHHFHSNPRVLHHPLEVFIVLANSSDVENLKSRRSNGESLRKKLKEFFLFLTIVIFIKDEVVAFRN